MGCLSVLEEDIWDNLSKHLRRTPLGFSKRRSESASGRVIYTHKTHSKMADQCAGLLRWLRIAQIAFSSVTASGAVGVLFSDSYAVKLITAGMSLATVALTAYMKGFDPGAAAQKHRDSAAEIWPIREDYLSLLTDIISGDAKPDVLRKRRDDLQATLAAIYRGAPHAHCRRIR